MSPTFLLVDKSCNRFIANRLQERYGFRGTPLRIIVKAKANRTGLGA